MKGFVYALSNKSLPGLIKIGFSTKDPSARAGELNGTGLPYDFEVIYEALIDDPYPTEQKIHTHLKNLDLHESKEFFRGTPEEIIREIKSVILEEDSRIYYENFFDAFANMEVCTEHDQKGCLIPEEIIEHPESFFNITLADYYTIDKNGNSRPWGIKNALSGLKKIRIQRDIDKFYLFTEAKTFPLSSVVFERCTLGNADIDFLQNQSGLENVQINYCVLSDSSLIRRISCTAKNVEITLYAESLEFIYELFGPMRDATWNNIKALTVHLSESSKASTFINNIDLNFKALPKLGVRWTGEQADYLKISTRNVKSLYLPDCTPKYRSMLRHKLGCSIEP